MSYLFIGSVIRTVNEAGEICLPSAYVETARGRGKDGHFFVGIAPDFRCLVAHDRSFLTQQQRDCEARRTAATTSLAFDTNHAGLRQMFSFVEQAALAQEGTLVLPPMLRARGRIGSRVLLVGMGDRFEIWGLDALLKNGPADLRMLAHMHLDTFATEGANHELDLQPYPPRPGTGDGTQPGLRVQHLSAVRPRHDPI